MKIRRVTSLTSLLSFTLLVPTIVVLYIVPQGRVAYWADWRLWGLTKTEWTHIHINLGLLFVLSIFLHIYYNWKPVVSYLKNKAKQIKVFTADFNVALILTVLFVTGTYFFLPPFSWVLNFNESLKDASALEYGEPPYGHAELSSLKTFTSKMGIDLSAGMARLKTAGIQFENEKQTLKDIANINKTSPQQLYLAMKPEEEPGTGKKMPDIPPPGLGKRSLADICGEYHLDMPAVLSGLSQNGITASPEMSMKKIAEQNKMNPIDVYDAVKKVSSPAP